MARLDLSPESVTLQLRGEEGTRRNPVGCYSPCCGVLVPFSPLLAPARLGSAACGPAGSGRDALLVLMLFVAQTDESRCSVTFCCSVETFRKYDCTVRIRGAWFDTQTLSWEHMSIDRYPISVNICHSVSGGNSPELWFHTSRSLGGSRI